MDGISMHFHAERGNEIEMSIIIKNRPTCLSEEASLGVLSASRNLWSLLYHQYNKIRIKR